MVAQGGSERHRGSERALFCQIGTHHLHIGSRVVVRSLIASEEGVVGGIALVIHVGSREIELGVRADGECVGQIERQTVGLDVLRTFREGVKIEIVGECTAGTLLVDHLAAQHKFVTVSKRIEEIETEAQVGEFGVHAIGNAVFVLHLLTGEPFLGGINGIRLRVLGEDVQPDIVPAHRGRGTVVFVTEVAKLHIAFHHRLIGGLLGDDIDGSGHGTAPVKSRTGTLYHLQTVDVVGTHLLKTIDTGQSRIDGLAVDEHLCMLGTQSLHTHFGEVAELALLLHADARNALKRLVDILCILVGNGLRGEHLRADGHILHVVGRARARHHHLIDGQLVFLKLEVGARTGVALHLHHELLVLISHHRSYNGLFAQRQIAEFEMAGGITLRHQTRAFHLDDGIGQMIARHFTLHIAKQHGIGTLRHRADHAKHTEHKK